MILSIAACACGIVTAIMGLCGHSLPPLGATFAGAAIALYAGKNVVLQLRDGE